MPNRFYAGTVFTEAIERVACLYREGHRVVVSFSAGKDSGVLLEITKLAAEQEGCMPVEAVIRDEEIMFPGTYEYAERVHARADIRLHWLVANQPIINIFNRDCPYWWVFDPLLKPVDWVRQPPSFAEYIPDLNIIHMADTKRFPPDKDKNLIHLIGLRTQESMRRKWAVSSAKGYLTKEIHGERNGNPIYDWRDGDVWKAILDNHWDYNHAYDTMARLGVPPRRLRIAPPTMSSSSVNTLRVAQRAWPQWFEKVCKRLPGIRAVTRFGMKAIQPVRRMGEAWEDCYKRTCIQEAPAWIAERATHLSERMLKRHNHHSTAPFPQVERCRICSNPGSWKMMTNAMYMGDPFCIKGRIDSELPYVEPEAFRKGAGTWEGKPTW
jgi:predicted phosphoadenosine phosphosulfate sulfurtransferase